MRIRVERRDAVVSSARRVSRRLRFCDVRRRVRRRHRSRCYVDRPHPLRGGARCTALCDDGPRRHVFCDAGGTHALGPPDNRSDTPLTGGTDVKTRPHDDDDVTSCSHCLAPSRQRFSPLKVDDVSFNEVVVLSGVVEGVAASAGLSGR